MKKILALSILSFMLVYSTEAYAAAKPAPAKTTKADTKTSVSGFYGTIEKFRISTNESITAEKASAAKEILASSKTANTTAESKPLDGVQQPIAYIKLFLLSIAGFIFGIAMVFYGIALFLVFLILRFFYRKIHNK